MKILKEILEWVAVIVVAYLVVHQVVWAYECKARNERDKKLFRIECVMSEMRNTNDDQRLAELKMELESLKKEVSYEIR